MIRRVALLSVTALPVLLSPAPVGAQPGSDYRAQILSHGINLSLTFPRRTYPQDALVRVTVRMENVSRRAVQIGGTGAAVCSRWGPGIQVTDAADRVLYPPALAWTLSTCGPVVDLRPLRPGHVIQRRLFVIFSGDRVRAIASVGTRPTEITTPPLTVPLVNEPSPHTTLRTTSPSEIDVSPATPDQHGHFYYIASEVCFFPPVGAHGQTGSGWGFDRFESATPGRHGVYQFPSGCEPPSRWSFAGGWLNHPVASIEYIRPDMPGR